MRMRMVFATLVVAALLGAGLALVIFAPPGQRFLTELIARTIAGSGQTITVKEIGGDWPSHIVWTGVSIADRQGTWLTLDRLELRLRPAALLSGRAEAHSIAAGTARVLRRPVSGPAASRASPPAIGDIAGVLGRISIREAQVQRLLLDPPVVGRAVEIALTGSLQDDPENRLHTLALDGRLRNQPGSFTARLVAGRGVLELRINVAVDAFAATGAITVEDRTAELSGSLKLTCGGEAACYAGPQARIGVLAADLGLSGTFTAPESALTLTGGDLVLGTRRLTRLQGEVAAAPRNGGGFAISGAGTAAGFPGALPEGLPLIGDDARWSFALTRASDGALTLDDARIESGDAAAWISALGLSPKLMPATVRLSLTGGARLLGLDDASSRTEVSVRVNRLEAGGVGAGSVTLETRSLPDGAGLPPLLTGVFDLNADVDVSAGRVAFTNILARSGAAAVRGTSTWSRAPRFDHAASALTLTLAPTGSFLPRPTQADVSLVGPLAALRAEVSATAAAVLLSRAPVYDAVISATIERRAGGFRAALDGNGRWIDGPLAFSARAAQDKAGVIDLPEVIWRSRTVDASGALALDVRTGILSGAVRGSVGDLAPLTEAFGVLSAGAADVTTTFSRGEGQHLGVTLAARDVRGALLNAAEVNATGQLDDLWEEARFTVRAQAEGAYLFGRPLAALTAGVRGTPRALTIDVSGKGADGAPFSLESVADVAAGESVDITVRRLAVRDGELDTTLLAPARLSLAPAAVTLDLVSLSVGEGEVEGSFSWNRVADHFDGAVRARSVPLPPFVAVPGVSPTFRVTGEATLSGPINAVNGELRLTGTLPEAGERPEVMVAASIALANGRAAVNASLSGISAAPARLTADLPARLDLAAARLLVSASEPVTGTLKWVGSLAPLWRLVPADTNVLTGDVAIDVSLAGTLETPVLGGGLGLSRGTYENLAGGTALRNIEARLGGDAQGFTLALKAQDMNDGSLTLSGRIAGGDRMTADITAELDRLDVLYRDDVVAAATGRLDYTGPITGGVLKGRVQTVRSLVRLGGSYMPEIPLLRPLPGFQPTGGNGVLAAIGLDIAVATADPIRIEGEGLDSLWRGDLSVAGTLVRPDVRGKLTLDRGSFSFLGQNFVLDSGAVTFTGGGTIDPQLAIVATRAAPDVTATVTIAGRARAPDVQLSSRPALPRDEILARLLFRKGTGELGPIESIQLASAASDLAGLSQGGINGLLRRTLGVDVTAGAEGDSVMVGRQFGRNLYVSVGQSLTEQEREIVVEWRFSRSLSVKSTTSDVAGADIGVFWRKDY